MERTDVLERMAKLQLYGMRAAGACPRAGHRPDPGDAVMTTGIKRRHEPPRIVGDLLAAEIAEKQARSTTLFHRWQRGSFLHADPGSLLRAD
jgi:hypothetical protein